MKPALAHILSTQWKYHDRIHEKIAHCLYQTSQLAGFSGKVVCGRRIGRETGLTLGIPLPSWACYSNGNVYPEDEEEDDGSHGIPGLSSELEAIHLVDFFDDLGRQ
ncbi:hypothetical protein SCP_0602110 [Sparassis crispa]|uniref:Uncharacterized protein n=1 Tax=Sparassis crispa TaxID=139825 RepID=A0A401GPU1_9APHY|nr:hypothetical protein SCP_0602110 [Sparassis crispa]GBE84233.1 hypothetical protein SCP_0602110 [Sparassis crispa]